MKYVTGNTQYEYLIKGRLVPKATYQQHELDGGKSPMLVLADDDPVWEERIMKKLIADKKVNISDAPPFETVQSVQAANDALNVEVAARQQAEQSARSYAEQIIELQRQLAELKEKAA